MIVVRKKKILITIKIRIMITITIQRVIYQLLILVKVVKMVVNHQKYLLKEKENLNVILLYLNIYSEIIYDVAR
jgi:hypothetical protein